MGGRRAEARDGDFARRSKRVDELADRFLSAGSLDEILQIGGVAAHQVAGVRERLKRVMRRAEMPPTESPVAYVHSPLPHDGSGDEEFGITIFGRMKGVFSVDLLATTTKLVVATERGRYLVYDLAGARSMLTSGGHVRLRTTSGVLVWDWVWYDRPDVDDYVDRVRAVIRAGMRAADARQGLHDFVGDSPSERLIRGPREAEEAAREWLAFWTQSDCRLTPVGPDSGVDIESPLFVAQVKMDAVPVGRPIVQQIFGIASLEEKSAAVFALAGFTPGAVTWAERAGVALFRFDLQGRPQPVNLPAGDLVERGRNPVERD